MKKIVACLISLALLLSSVAFAEEVENHGTPTDIQPTTPPMVTEEPTATEAPTAEPTVTEEPVQSEVTEEPVQPEATEAPTETVAPTAVPEHKVTITLEHTGDKIYFGDMVTLRATLSGYENTAYTLQWLLNGNPVQGANELTYTFTASQELCGEWQLVVMTAE